MPKQLYTNNASAPLDVTITSGATSLTLGTGFANFASPTGGDFQMATLTDGVNIEIVKITARSSGTLTVVRAQEGTTAQAWTGGACTVSARITAGMLGQIVQNESATTDAIAVTNSATTQPAQATGLRSVAIGRFARATGADAIAVGMEAQCAGAAAVGAQANASGSIAAAIGQAATASGDRGVALGSSATASAADTVAAGYLAAASGANAAAVGRSSAASGARSLALGNEATATAADAVAMGYRSKAAGVFSFAGPGARTYSPNAWAFGGHPTIQRNDWSIAIDESRITAGAEGTFATVFVDLGNVPPWTTATAYTDGDVVRPTTDNGKQYFITLYGASYDAAAIPNTIATGGTTEPSWPTTAGAYVDVIGSGIVADYTCMDLLNGFTVSLPEHTLFFPTEFGFVCTKYASVTAAPYVSIGTAANPNLYVNNQQLTGITGALQIQRLTPLVNTSVSELQFKLNTKATGANSQFHGRFYAKGLFIQAQG